MQLVERWAKVLFADALQSEQFRCARCLVEDGLFSLRAGSVPGRKILVEEFLALLVEVVDHSDTVRLFLRAAVVESSRERDD